MFIIYIAVLLVSFYLLHFFTEYYFIPSLDKIGEKLKMSSDISGSTLMAAGSSAPELAVMIISVLKSGNHEAIGIGTIVGSALFNLFVITGVVMIVKNKAKLVWQPLTRDLLFYAIAVVALIFSFSDGYISLLEALIFLGLYIFYIFVLYYWKKIFPYKDIENLNNLDSDKDSINRHERIAQKFLNISYNIVFIVSIAIITVLSWVLVESAIYISEFLKIPEFIIALTIIAMGTSIPDLVSSTIVAKQGRAGMAINNGIGSNIFDILIGLGIPLFVLSYSIHDSIKVSAADINVAFSFLIGSIIILFLMFFLSKWNTRRIMGVILIIFYIFYLAYEVACEIGFDICFR